MLLGGIASSEAIDSSAEVVKLDGIDVTSIQNGTAVANYEHNGAQHNGSEIVGVIVYGKKIYEAKDCDTDHQKECLEITRGIPYLYIVVRLYDGAGHPGAIALAAQIRDHVKNGDAIIAGFSIEGSTLKRSGNTIEESILRKVAITLSPCNKTAKLGMLADPNAPDGFRKSEFLGDTVLESIKKSESLAQIRYNTAKISELVKTITAGSTDAAPSALSGGAALQKESVGNQIRAALRDYGKIRDRARFKEFVKARLPDVSDSFIEHFADLAEDIEIKKSEIKARDASLIGLRNAWEAVYIDLKKSLSEIGEGHYVEHPEVHQVSALLNGAVRPIGRIMLHNGRLHHLEDYHGILARLLPQGELNEDRIAQLDSLTKPVLTTSPHDPEFKKEKKEPELSVTPAPVPRRESVFEYVRPGFHRPHLIEFGPHGASLDGSKLTEPQLDLVLSNLKRGVAQLRYRDTESSLRKSDDLEDALQHIRSAVSAGHLHPDIERTLTKHIMEDPMIPGVGNKYSWDQFKAKGRPGVYISADGNSFKSINDSLGHEAGDDAIRSMGTALRAAADKVGSIKLHRAGGDEFAIHAPTHEHALAFLHEAHKNLGALDPIRGVHKASMSFGVGTDFGTADRALYHAKSQKLDTVSQKSMYHPQKTPNFAHSLVPENEGPIQLGHSLNRAA